MLSSYLYHFEPINTVAKQSSHIQNRHHSFWLSMTRYHQALADAVVIDTLHIRHWSIHDNLFNYWIHTYHYNDATMSAMASQITSLAIVHSSVHSSKQSGFCEGNNSPVTGEFPAQRARTAEHLSIWLRQHGSLGCNIVKQKMQKYH